MLYANAYCNKVAKSPDSKNFVKLCAGLINFQCQSEFCLYWWNGDTVAQRVPGGHVPLEHPILRVTHTI